MSRDVKCKEVGMTLVLGWLIRIMPYCLVCVLFGTDIPTSFFNLFLYSYTYYSCLYTNGIPYQCFSSAYTYSTRNHVVKSRFAYLRSLSGHTYINILWYPLIQYVNLWS